MKAIKKGTADEIELAYIKANTLLEEQKTEKAAAKAEENALIEKTKTRIENLTDEEATLLLSKKWVSPICDGLAAIPAGILTTFVSAVKALSEKYKTTYSDVCDDIAKAERKLLGMLGDLTGNEYDMAGLAEFANLLGGE